MALLEIVQDVCDELGLAPPSIVVGATDPMMRRMLSMLNAEGRALLRRHAWTVLQAEHTFTTVSGTANYALPSDYHRLLDETLWDRARYEQMRGPLSPAEWQQIKSGIASSVIYRRWRIKGNASGGRFFIDPTPTTTGDTLVFEYVRNTWCQSTDGTAQATWLADTDTTPLPEELFRLGLTWRFLRASELSWENRRAEYVAAVDSEVASDGGAPVLSLAGTGATPFLIGPWNVPDSGYGV